MVSDARYPPLSPEARQLLTDLAAARGYSLSSKGRAPAARDLLSRGLATGAPGRKITLSPAGAWSLQRSGGEP